MKNAFILQIPMAILITMAALVIGCSDTGSPVAPDNDDALRIESVTVSSLSTVLSPSQYDVVPTGQKLTLMCKSSGADGADLSTLWSANCGEFNRTDSCAVEWVAPDTNASAEIAVTVSDGHQQAGDTLRLGILSSHTWERSYNLGSYEDGQDVLIAGDGGYVVLVSHGGVNLVKIAADGSILWRRLYVLGGSYWARSVTALPDGGYAITGGRRVSDGTALLWDVFVLRLDAQGNLLWQKIFGGEGGDAGYDAVATPDGGLLVVGGTGSFGGAGEGVYLVRIDADGNLLWQKTYPGMRGTSIIATSDGGYAITGEIGIWCVGASDVFLLMVDADGNMIRQLTYGDIDGELSFAVIETPSGGFAIAGQAYSPSNGDTDGFLFLTDHEGNLTKWTDFGGSSDDLVRDVVNRPQGGFAVAGYTKSFGEGGWDMYLTAFDGGGTFEWGSTFGGSELEEGQGLVCTKDDGFVVVGRTMSFSTDLCDLYVVKTDKNGRIWQHPEEEADAKLLADSR
ncbi:MAG: hypothetical protein JSV52_12485 [Candidatus Zixiibacteriota bacterium]|nr:MAG: hypothetical protein JSV52_12485 [candidate division Zixibacteria bacterium]